MFFFKKISKKRSSKNTFGWVRAEVLGALINSVFLLSLCLSILIEAIERFVQTETIREVNLLLYVACTGFGINTFGLLIFGHGHSHDEPIKKAQNNGLSIEISVDSESSPIIASSPRKSYLNEQYSTSQASINNINTGSLNNLINQSAEDVEHVHKHASEQQTNYDNNQESSKCCKVFSKFA